MLTEINGTIVRIFDQENTQWQGKVFTKQKVLLETYEYDKKKNVIVEINPEKIDMNKASVGDMITFKASIESKEGKNGMWFTNIKGYGIAEHRPSQRQQTYVQQQSQPQQPQSYVQTQQPQQRTAAPQAEVKDDDLPF